MLQHLRDRVIRCLASAHSVTLSTAGPAGLQASRLPCQAVALELFVLVPRTSDHLFNLEQQPDVVVVGEAWHLNGYAEIVRPEMCPAELARRPEAAWSKTVMVHPLRLTLLEASTGSPLDTIDINEANPIVTT